MIPVEGDDSFPVPPFELLYTRLLEHAETLDRQADGGDRLRGLATEWWNAQQAWNATLGETLAVHHEINNALVGVRGNAQLMIMGPAGKDPDLRARLEVVLRESGRIQNAASRIRRVRGRFPGGAPTAKAA